MRRADRPQLRNWLGAMAVLVVIASAVAGTPPSAAQTTPAGVLELAGQTTWWQPEQPFELTLALQTSTPESVVVAISIYRKITTRTEFAATLKGRTAGRPIEDIPPVSPSALTTNADGTRTLSFTPTLRADGVYPLRVELRPASSAGGPPSKAIASLVTYLVHVPAQLEGDELAVALVVPVHAPPAVQPDGRVSIDDARAERLAELATAIEAQPGVAFSLAPTPETVEALAGSPRNEDRTTLATLARGLGDRQLVGGPYVPTNLTSMLQAGLSEEMAAQLTRGTAALGALFARVPTTETRVVDERLTPEAVGSLQTEQQVRRLVIPEPLLEPVTRRTTLTNSFEIDGPKGRMPAAAADAGLSAHFSGRDAVLGAHRLLADLAVIYNDDPAAARRGVIVSPPQNWDPSGAFASTLLVGLATSPILQGVTLDTFFGSVAVASTGTGSRTAPMLRKFGSSPPGTPSASTLPGASIGQGRRRVDAFASALDPANPLIDRLDRTLLVSESIDLRARDRLRYLEGVTDQVGGEIAKIAMPQNRSITLTARQGEIPVTITSNLDYPVRGVLRVASDTLDFPDGASQNLDLMRRNTTSQFTVRAQSSGSFPVRVRLESPDGLVLAESRFTVRSTAISGVGTALSIGAGLFLLVWWANHLRGRRSRRLVPAATDPDGPPA